MRSGVRVIALTVAMYGCGYPRPDVATRDASSADVGGDAMPDARALDAAEAVTIQQVQSSAMPVETPVVLEGVIITAIDAYGMKTGEFWIEEPGGGAYSGVAVFNVPPTGFAVGDLVSLRGVKKSEFALSSDTTGRTVTELVPETGAPIMVKTGTATVPAAQPLDALAIQQLAEPAQSQEWGKWEGVLVTLPNVRVNTNAAQIGGDPTLQSVQITGNITAQTNLAAFPAGVTANACLASATGVIDYLFTYQVLPRTTSAIVTGGSACP